MPHVAPAFHIQKLWKEEAALSLRAADVPGVVALGQARAKNQAET